MHRVSFDVKAYFLYNPLTLRAKGGNVLVSKEVKKWQEDSALQRYSGIDRLLDPDIDPAKKAQLREEAAKQLGVSVRTVYRYESGFRENGFEGLKPKDKTQRRSKRLPADWDTILAEAIQLKKEVPRRSVRQIIKILEMEGTAAPGAVKQSTLQRHLFKAGFGTKQMRRYTEHRETTARRFCRPHRMELIQADIKYGPDIRTKDGKLVKTYLSTLIDDHSRFPLHSVFYDNKSASVVEDSIHKAVLLYGKFDACYTDNGSEYISKQLVKSCARLGIKLLRCKPRRGESKGKVEKFHQVVDSFIAEIRVSPVHTLEELNRKWEAFLDQDYKKEPHGGIREYYESQGVEVPGGISPLMEWSRDSRSLVFFDTATVSEAFRHHEERILDQAGCFSFSGRKYEASTALAGAKVEISYDPLYTETIAVHYEQMAPIMARPVSIGAYADKTPPIPASMAQAVPASSRFLDALEKQYLKEKELAANAISFSSYGKEVM